MIGQHIGEGKPDKGQQNQWEPRIVLFAIIGIAMTVILGLFAGGCRSYRVRQVFWQTVLYLRICSAVF